MKTIDLHGVRHADVESIMLEACAASITPFTVITGQSDAMKKLVGDAVKIMGLTARDSISNPGRLIVDEGK